MKTLPTERRTPRKANVEFDVVFHRRLQEVTFERLKEVLSLWGKVIDMGADTRVESFDVDQIMGDITATIRGSEGPPRCNVLMEMVFDSSEGANPLLTKMRDMLNREGYALGRVSISTKHPDDPLVEV